MWGWLLCSLLLFFFFPLTASGTPLLSSTVRSPRLVWHFPAPARGSRGSLCWRMVVETKVYALGDPSPGVTACSPSRPTELGDTCPYRLVCVHTSAFPSVRVQVDVRGHADESTLASPDSNLALGGSLLPAPLGLFVTSFSDKENLARRAPFSAHLVGRRGRQQQCRPCPPSLRTLSPRFL